MTIDNAEHSAVRSEGGVRKSQGGNVFRRMGTVVRAVSQPTVSAAS
ncbi:hypothetical protein [Mycobacterium paragordonae]|nr:hypothetical protein [Mycobacterium paragordonae]